MPLTFSPSKTSTHLTLSNGNLTITNTPGGWYSGRVDESPPVELLYWEFHIDTTHTYYMVGVAEGDANMDSYLGSSTKSMALLGAGATLYRNGGAVGTLPSSHNFGTAGDVVGVAWDSAAGKVWFSVNGTWSGDPIAGTGAAFASVPSGIYAAVSMYDSGSQMTALFNADEWSYTAPTGYHALGEYVIEPLPVIMSMPTTIQRAFTGLVTDVTAKLLPPLTYLGDHFTYGAGYISGIITEKGTPDTPVARKVRLHRKIDGLVQATTWSAADGTYEFRPIPMGEYYVVSFDHLDNFNAVIRDSIMAEPIT